MWTTLKKRYKNWQAKAQNIWNVRHLNVENDHENVAASMVQKIFARAFELQVIRKMRARHKSFGILIFRCSFTRTLSLRLSLFCLFLAHFLSSFSSSNFALSSLLLTVAWKTPASFCVCVHVFNVNCSCYEICLKGN